ncbi:MAG: DUF1806 family protein, partial [Actinomycetota bacterium]|nr:DUF1806 family protein [Actinomycetota bacterium]
SRALRDTKEPAGRLVEQIRGQIEMGGDPLGDAFCRVRDASARRADGAVYTPDALIDPMVAWTLKQEPGRVVDAGVGSGRFLAAVARRSPRIPLVGVDLDPLATLMTRANLAVIECLNVRVLQDDYTRLQLPGFQGTTAFVGNPPYVRHHQLTPAAKLWAQNTAAALGQKISGLAGLHAYFFLATAAYARRGDVGSFVTSAEWLDVNYGSIMRQLVLGHLGGESLHVVEPKALPFEGTATTAVITNFRVGEQPESIRMRPVDALTDMGDLAEAGRPVARQRLLDAPRWSGLLRTSPLAPEGYVELGEICRVHRGTVTGANAVWVLRHKADLPESVLYASVTKARELFAAGTVLSDAEMLRRVVDIPSDLDELGGADRKKVDQFIRTAKKAGVDKGYIAAHRRAWWSIGLKHPAPILATYMARRPPAFVLNQADARHINIAHGLYPREELNTHALTRLAESLRAGIKLSQGRVYAGGLTKFEPKEMERLMVPDVTILCGHDPITAPVDV